jgi:hypothetical protein
MQATAHFVFWTILLQTVIGFALAYLIDRKFRGHGFWTTIILIPMMLSPAVVGNFWTLPLPAADRPVQLRGLASSPASAVSPSRCSATSRWRPGRSSSSIPGCGRPM